MDSYAQKDFSKILKNNAQSQRHEKLAEGTDVFRIYDRNLEAFPVTVDLYSSYARVVDYGDSPMTDEDREICLDIICRFAYIDRQNIVYMYRAKREKGQQHEKNDAEPVIVNVKEGGLVFKTNLSSYTDSGLFLDHANTRQFIKDNCAEKDVLNLFSYTGSFSVYAASGLAKTVTSVDMSATYTKWAEENLSLNGFEGVNYKCICSDAAKFIEEQMNNNQRYDIIIFDPPSFSNSHKMEHDFDVQRDFVFWIKNLTRLLRKGGFILFSTNLGSFKMDRRRLKGLSVKELTYSLWAEGFVKGRKGTVRSWIMSVNDDSLSLDWSEEKKPAPQKRDYRSSDRPRERRHYEDRDDRRRYDDRPGDRRNFEHRDFRDRDNRRHFDDRPRERRNFEDRDDRRRYDDRPRERRNFEHKDFRDRDRDSRRHYDDRPRERRNFEDRDDRRRYDDRPRERRSFDSRDERRSKKPSKPYGYDSFKPARNRDDSADFFWNSDDIKPKKG